MKKLISLFLVFSILALSGNLLAKEKKGAELIIQKIDGTHVRGELIAVKESSLLLLDSQGADVSVDIMDIGVIDIVRKSELWKGARIGFLIGTTSGLILGMMTAQIWGSGDGFFSSSEISGEGLALATFNSALLGTLIGGFIGRSKKGKLKTLQIKGSSDSEIQEILEYLRKKARIRNFQ